MSEADSIHSLRTTWPLMSIPRIAFACSSASPGPSASLIPPAFPRPPVSTCALTTTCPPSSSAAFRASSGEVASRPTRTWTTPTPTRTTLTATPTTRTRSAGALRRCIEPVGEGEFLAEHWERRPLVVERDEPGLELPLRNQKYTAEMGGPGEPVHDLVLRPGDMLYLPRGWLHEALTSDSDSLHLTVGVNVVTWLDAFKAALEECGDELGFRRSIGDGDMGELVDVLRGRLTADAVERRAAEKLARTRRPIRDGQLFQLRAIDELDVDTEVELRETVLVHASEHNGSFELTFDGKEVAFPARIRDEVSWVLERDDPFTAADLPGDLDDESRLVLVRRLIREGLLRISAA